MKKRLLKILGLLAIICIGVNIYLNSTISVTKFSLNFPELPDSFDGFKIAQVSDFHNDNSSNKVIRQVSSTKPDIIVITGDLVDSSKYNLQNAEELVSGLVKIAPTYFVSGNHEAWSGKYDEVKQMLKENNVSILEDESVKINRDGSEINLIGLIDPSFLGLFDYEIFSVYYEKLNQLISGDINILLSHRPEIFDMYVESKVELVLSGHAHGGQFRLPFIGGVIAPNQGFFPKFDAGKFVEDETTMIVSRGIGNSIIPFRIFNGPEIVEIELKK